MRRFSDLPIKQKLMVIIIVTTAAALLLAGVGILVADSVLFKGYLEADLDTFSRVIADNSTAALAFDDPRSAGDVLNALRARPHIVAACLYNAREYVRSGSGYQCGRRDLTEGIRTVNQLLTATRGVVLSGRRIGTLVIVYDLMEIWDRLRLYGVTVLVVLLCSTGLVVLLSSNLRALFVSPIVQLADTTALVSASKNYAVRATPLMNDEVGRLAEAFNEMLAGIESRDHELLRTLADREEGLKRLAALNKDLQKSNDDLARSNKDLERFAFIASHDMQEPLRMVTIYSELLVKTCGDEAGAAASFKDHIVGGTSRMRDLLSDLLAYVEVTTAPGKVELVDLNMVIEKVKANLSVRIAENSAKITHDPLPATQVHLAHAISVFQNLIGNAIKYRSEAPPEIFISTKEENGRHRITVKDNGIGIAPEYHANIFLAFTRLHGKVIPGTGIGLAICQRIVERYGGQISVESELGKGAAFIFTLPRQEVGNTDDSDTRQTSHPVG
jgi:signal transduction histidine kinase